MSDTDDFKVDVSEYQLVFKLLKDLNKDKETDEQDQEDSLKISKVYDLIQAFETPSKTDKEKREGKNMQSSAKAANKSKESSIEKKRYLYRNEANKANLNSR